MTIYKEIITNAQTGEITERLYNNKEITEMEAAEAESKIQILQKAAKDTQTATDKAALLAKLGITADEAKLLLS